MKTFLLWRLTDKGWKPVKSVYSDKTACCSTYEKVLKIGKRP